MRRHRTDCVTRTPSGLRCQTTAAFTFGVGNVSMHQSTSPKQWDSLWHSNPVFDARATQQKERCFRGAKGDIGNRERYGLVVSHIFSNRHGFPSGLSRRKRCSGDATVRICHSATRAGRVDAPAEFEITDPDGYVICLSQQLEDGNDLPTPAA